MAISKIKLPDNTEQSLKDSRLPDVTSTDNGKGLIVSNGEWSVESISGGGSGVAGTLNTTATTAQSTNASESLGGTVVLHKIAKTGTYSDLIGAPTMEALTTSEIDTIWTNAA